MKNLLIDISFTFAENAAREELENPGTPRLYKKKLPLVAYLLLLCFAVKAQSPGIIVRPAGGGIVTLLNPNGDSWSSTGSAGFINNDSTESEIPFKGVPVAIAEITGDLSQGPIGGFTELVKPTPGHGFYVYSDGTNLYFRMRVGGIVSGAKGYSVLIDADSRFGATGTTADPNYVASTTNNNGNAGFEWEVVLETTKRVAIYSVDGTSIPILANSYSIATNSQISVAITTDSGTPDYFYDFVVPLSGFSGYSPVITASTPLRFCATTVMSPNPATGGSKSDIYGVANFTNAGNAYTTIINQTPAVTPNNLNTPGFIIPAIRTAAPVLTTPISTGTVTVQGTWTRLDTSKASTATIYLYKNGVLVGTTSVSSGGTWSIPNITSATGDVFYATAQGPGESVSPDSNYYTVIGCTPASTSTTTGLDFTCSSDRGMMGNRPANASVKLYVTTISGTTLFRTDASSPYAVTYPTSTTWRYDDVNTQSGSACTGGAADIAVGQYSITATQSGLCESAKVFTGGCSLGSTTATPVITQTTLYQGNTTISGTAASGATVRYYKNGFLVSTQVASGTAYSFTNVTLYGGDVITVLAQSTGLCISAAATRTVVILTNPPVITTNASGTLTAGATTITGTSSEAAGTTIRVYNGSGTLLGTTTVLANGTWSLSTTVTSGQTYYATAQASGAAVSVQSPTVSVQTGTTIVPTITGSYTDAATLVAGTLPSLFTGKIYLYLDGQKIDSVSVTVGLVWSIPVNTTVTNALYAGGVLTATAQASGNAENSTTSNSVTVSCSIPVIPVIAPAVAAMCKGNTVTFTLTTSQSGILYSIRDNSDAVNLGLSKFGTGGSITLTSSALNTAGIFTVRVKATSFSGTGCESYTAAVLTVDPLSVGGIVSNDTSVCTGTNSATILLSGFTGIVQAWESSNDNFSSAATAISNTTGILTVNNLTATTYYRAVVKSGTCLLASSAVIRVTVDAATVSGSLSGNGGVCTGSNSTLLSLASNTGSVVKWQSSTDNFSSVINDISNTSSSLTATNLTANTQYRAFVKNGACATATTSAVEIVALPTGRWTGGTTGNWNVPANWCGGLPTATSDVSIPAGSTVNINGADINIHSVNINSGASITMTGTTNLTIAAGGTFTSNGSFDASGSTGAVVFAGSGTISGTVTFKNIQTYGAIDFGISATVSGIFSLQPGGSVTGHSPTYTCPSAVLLYNTGSVFLRNLEWTTNSSGTGYPANVTIQNNTTINFPVVGQGYICNDLTIENGSSLRQDYSGGSATLRVGRNVTINGTLSLGAASGGDVYLGGSWTRNAGAVFNHNDRKVTFDGPSNFSGNGTSMATISAPASAAKDNEGGFGGEKFAHIWINKTNAADSVVLLSNITVTRELGFTKGTFSLRNSDVTIVSNSTRTADIAPVTAPVNISVRYVGTGRFVVQRFIQNPTATRSWRLLASPLQSASAPSINQAYMEGSVNSDKNNPNGSGGIYNPWTGYGTHITGPGGLYSAANGFDQGTSAASILYANAGVTTWTAPSSTITTKVTDQQGWMLFVRGDRGFTIGNQYVPSQNATLEPKGKINIGDATVPVIFGKQVIGNPYVSAISLLNADIAGTAGKNSTYYMWDPKMFTSYTQPGKWVTFTGVGNSFVYTTSESAYPANGTIESGQAFAVDAAAAGSLTFHESDKLPLTSSLTGIANATGARPMADPSFAMFRSDVYANNSGIYKLTDGVLNIFDPSYNNAADGSDAKKFINFNTKESLSILRDSVKLAIEKRMDIQLADTIFFTMAKFNELPYQFRFTASNFNPGIEAFLEDKFTGSRSPVSTSGATIVNFDITADSLSKAAGRFRIVFKSAFGNVLPVRFTNVKAWQQNKNITVQWKVANELNIKEYEVHKSLDGVNFDRVNTALSLGNLTGNYTYNWLDENAVSGDNYYRIMSRDVNASEQYSLIMKVNIAQKTGSISVYPNPVTDGIIKLRFDKMEKGEYDVRLLNNGGQLLLSKQVNHPGGDRMHAIATERKIVGGIYNVEIKKAGIEKKIVKVIIK